MLVLLLMQSCDKQTDYVLPVPKFEADSGLSGTLPLSDSSKFALEGIYKVTEGSDIFGDTLVLKQTKDKISLFGNKSGIYAILDAGSQDSKIILEGYWRYALNSRTGLVSLFLTNAEQLINGNAAISTITFSGNFNNDQFGPCNSNKYRFAKKIHCQVASRSIYNWCSQSRRKNFRPSAGFGE